ncbi:type II toxin-antitoxin system VapC family toxin [bacterium]|nr:type II toxin-antitoxin system VapC family toxin [bacterium]OIO89725.1 MAG: twitching motility protein PilT [Anaerolineae bacterium CG2_30_58_95]PIW19271.1 MAG: PIN domain nuclease [Anaerolineae bacterium CG17_big_fil_post_rev_8_21_14_2_50_57_27]PJH75758.1 MAG: PIN domain nuclease [Anaerolineae bacterium CG_4_9_14_0_8_um_filter_58_9]
MNLLLDTHAFLWFIAGDSSLSQSARSAIEDLNNNRYLSVASLWEIAIKVSIDKLTLSEPFETLIPEQLAENIIELLDISFEHTALIASMPFHHRDPFDRLIAAQARIEQMTLVSVDDVFDAYGVTRLW